MHRSARTQDKGGEVSRSIARQTGALLHRGRGVTGTAESHEDALSTRRPIALLGSQADVNDG